MKNKKLAVLFNLIIILAIMPSAISASPVDMVVLLDTSSSVIPIYDDLVNYIIGNVLKNHLKYGDTFHLISFDSTPSNILSKQIKDKNDIEYVLKELFLLNPLGKYTDLVMALKYLRQYVSDISGTGTREIIILTDGIHDPPPDSPYLDIVDQKTGVNLLDSEIRELNRSSWKLSVVRLPEEKAAEGNALNTDTVKDSHGSEDIVRNDISGTSGTSGTSTPGGMTDPVNPDEQDDKSYSDNDIFRFLDNNDKIYKSDFEETLGNGPDAVVTGSPRIHYPEEIGKISYHFTLPLKIENFYPYPLLLKLEKVYLSAENTGPDQISSDRVNILGKKFSIEISPEETVKHDLKMRIPSYYPEGDYSIRLALEFSDDNRAFPSEVEYRTTLKGSFFDIVLKSREMLFRIFLILLALSSIAGFILVLRYYFGLSVRESYSVVRKDIDHAVVEGKRRPVAMKVSGQNDQVIGNRNIHIFSPGTVKSVGGKHSSFLIFLYRIPGIIAHMEFDGNSYVFRPAAAEYFPELAGNTLDDALDIPIKVRTPEGNNIEIVFSEYVSKLEKINALMKITEHKGLPEDRRNLIS